LKRAVDFRVDGNRLILNFFFKERENELIELKAVLFFCIISCLAISNILKSEPLFNYFSFNFEKLSLSLPYFLTAKLKF
jgi:hypothetical protein